MLLVNRSAIIKFTGLKCFTYYLVLITHFLLFINNSLHTRHIIPTENFCKLGMIFTVKTVSKYINGKH